MDVDEIVGKIRNNSLDVSEFMEEYKPFIAACASGVVKRFLYFGEDDELGIALMAFYEAMMVYDLKKGKFLTFARGVIQRRLIDYMRAQKKEQLAPMRIDEDETGWEEYENSASLNRYDSEKKSENLRLEIAALESELAEFGIQFADIAANCPKHKKLAQDVKKAALMFAGDEKLFKRFMETRRFPVKEFETATGLPQKKIERFRKYIIAVAIIFSGDYEYLKEYVKGS